MADTDAKTTLEAANLSSNAAKGYTNAYRTYTDKIEKLLGDCRTYSEKCSTEAEKRAEAVSISANRDLAGQPVSDNTALALRSTAAGDRIGESNRTLDSVLSDYAVSYAEARAKGDSALADKALTTAKNYITAYKQAVNTKEDGLETRVARAVKESRFKWLKNKKKR